MSDPLSVPLPVITTHRPDRRDRGYLAWVAVANEIAHLPLDSAPVDAIPHALEIHVSGIDEPLVVIAEPMGPPMRDGASAEQDQSLARAVVSRSVETAAC